MTTHIKTHSNVRPFICLAKGCGKAYYHSRSLKKHEKTHEVATTPILSTPNSVIQYSTAATTPFSNAIVGNNNPGVPQQVQVDYLNSQLPMSIHSQSLPNTPHPSLTQQSSNNFALLQHTQPQQSSSHVKAYTPNNNVLSYPPAGMVDQQQQRQNEQIISQQQHQHHQQQQQQLFDSANQQQNFEYKLS